MRDKIISPLVSNGVDKNELWQALLAQIQFNISKANFATWFRNTGIVSKEDGGIVVSVPNNFSKEWLENKYNKLILKILRSLDDGVKEVKYNVAHTETKPREIPPNPAPDDIYNNSAQMEFAELRVNKETNLNPRYTFNNFIVGPFNELPQAAALAIVRAPGSIYNPLFVYGGVGLGKTHLIQAIGNEIAKKFPEKKIKYLSSEKLTSGIVSSIQNHSIDKLKLLYKDLDVLIVDDI